MYTIRGVGSILKVAHNFQSRILVPFIYCILMVPFTFSVHNLSRCSFALRSSLLAFMQNYWGLANRNPTGCNYARSCINSYIPSARIENKIFFLVFSGKNFDYHVQKIKFSGVCGSRFPPDERMKQREIMYQFLVKLSVVSWRLPMQLS